MGTLQHLANIISACSFSAFLGIVLTSSFTVMLSDAYHTYSSSTSTISVVDSKTSWREMMLGCCNSFKILISLTMSSRLNPRRLTAFLLFLINLPANSVLELFSTISRTSENFPLEKWNIEKNLNINISTGC